MEIDTQVPSSLPAEKVENDLFVKMKTLERQLELAEIQEDYIKHEHKNLKRVKKIKNNKMRAKKNKIIKKKKKHTFLCRSFFGRRRRSRGSRAFLL
jgi:hypothetical protein